MQILKDYWPTIVLIVEGLWSTLSPQVLAWVSMHPQWTAVLAIAQTVVAHLLTSPLQPSPQKLARFNAQARMK